MTNNKQQTAVEWLEERLILSFGYELKPLIGFFIIAKEMEEEQMIDFAYKALMEADMTSNRYVDVDKLYNKTYRGGEQ